MEKLSTKKSKLSIQGKGCKKKKIKKKMWKKTLTYCKKEVLTSVHKTY